MAQYTTPELVAAELRSETFTELTEPTLATVENWILEESAKVEVIAGEIFEATDYVESIDYVGDQYIQPSHFPIITLTSLEYDRANEHSAEDWTTLVTGKGNDYITYLEDGEIYLSSSSYIPGHNKFKITYRAGYETTPLNVQRLTTLMIGKRVISSLINAQTNQEGGEIQIGPIRVKDPSNFSINYINNINQEIKDLTDDIGLGFKTYRINRRY